MELRKALSQIDAIHQQLARSERVALFRGWRAVPVAGSGVLAMAVALVQARWLPDPAARLDLYLAMWLMTAAVAVAASATEVYRCWRFESPRKWSATRAALGQFLPPLLLGGAVTTLIVWRVPQAGVLLPGLWAIFYALGMVAARRYLPAGMVAVAGYFLFAGLTCLWAADRAHALSPWAMGATFGLGQIAAAVLLMDEGADHD